MSTGHGSLFYEKQQENIRNETIAQFHSLPAKLGLVRYGGLWPNWGMAYLVCHRCSLTPNRDQKYLQQNIQHEAVLKDN